MINESQIFEERLRKQELENICEWCGQELNNEHDDMCKYLNR